MSRQWTRVCSLVVGDMTGNGIDLAGTPPDHTLRIRFSVHYACSDAPASLTARIYNLSRDTIQRVIDFASKGAPNISGLPYATSAKIVLKAGYIEQFGTIFTGQIYQMRVGKESNVDSYLDIYAADGDLAYNFSNVAVTLSAGYTPVDVWNQCGQSMVPWQTTCGPPPEGLSTRRSVRGKVLFGNSREVLNDLANTHSFTWNILNSQLQGLPKFTYRPGMVIKVNSQTGMVGVPEQTEEGVSVLTLLNPAIRWGTCLQINEQSIAHYINKLPGSAPNGGRYVSPEGGYRDQSKYLPPLNPDGVYAVLYATHTGDTRGNEWYTKSIAISADPNAPKPMKPPSVPFPPAAGG